MGSLRYTIYVGFEPRQPEAFAVTRRTFRSSAGPIPVRAIHLADLVERGLYRRETTRTPEGQLYDVISEHTMATEFAISRFLAPHLAEHGWTLFADCDMLKRLEGPSLLTLFHQMERDHGDQAIVCVKHDHVPITVTKMDGQVQSTYARKNWSSFMMINCDHPANRELTVDLINSVPGRDLHRFCWIEDEALIGELDPAWNYLAGSTKIDHAPFNVHFTEGLPNLPGYENSEYAAEWWAAYRDWVRYG